MVEITQEFLKEHFEYRDGGLWWIKKSSPHSPILVGSRFGSIFKKGYRRGTFKRKDYLEHRLIWLYYYGTWPQHHIDHINGTKDDNRIENLREATSQQNNFNKGSRKNSSSIYKGVHWVDKKNKWRVRCDINGVKLSGGFFTKEVEAAKKYDLLIKEHHGNFARLNFG